MFWYKTCFYLVSNNLFHFGGIGLGYSTQINIAPEPTTQSSVDDVGRQSYWDIAYSDVLSEIPQSFPSQFAAFCVGEIASLGSHKIIDLACGNGRDTLFFAQQGFDVLAIEKSHAAIRKLSRLIHHLENVQVSIADLVNDEVPSSQVRATKCTYYSRFFIHTLHAPEIDIFMGNLAANMKAGELFMTEYRNEHDALKFKKFDNHFRAFHSSRFVADTASKHGLECRYTTEGIGLAKWHDEDPSVTRQIFIKTGEV